jgi:hypothetical protein
MQSQTPLPRGEALKQLYQDYDPVTKTAHWICTKSQQQEPHDGWPCSERYAKVTVAVELSAQVVEHGTEKTYLIASAQLTTDDPRDSECHSCAPAIGVAVFAWRHERWEIESANASVDFSGEWGEPPKFELVAIGPEHHGVILWSGFSGQGYHESTKHLLAPIGITVSDVWQLCDEQDDAGAFYPKDKLSPHRLYDAEVAFKFTDIGNDDSDYYDIIEMSRGSNDMGKANWTRQYRFRDGKYRLLRKITFMEREAPATKSAQHRSTTQK